MKKQTSIIIGIKDNRVLLGMKKRGHGEGYWNGFGGKRNQGESLVESALREIEEEAGIVPSDLKEVGLIDFTIFETRIYTFSEFEGEPTETEEMKPEWFDLDKLPYSKMWEGDKIWFPLVLDGKEFEGKFDFEDKKLKAFNVKIKN